MKFQIFYLSYIEFYLNKIYMMHQNQIFSNFTIDFSLSYMWFFTFDHKILYHLMFFLKKIMQIIIILIWPNFTLYIV